MKLYRNWWKIWNRTSTWNIVFTDFRWSKPSRIVARIEFYRWESILQFLKIFKKSPKQPPNNPPKDTIPSMVNIAGVDISYECIDIHKTTYQYILTSCQNHPQTTPEQPPNKPRNNPQTSSKTRVRHCPNIAQTSPKHRPSIAQTSPEHRPNIAQICIKHV